MSVTIKVISPEKIVWDTEAEQIVLPSLTGGLGILTNHAPLVSVLQTGILKKFDQQVWTPIVLLGGIAQIEDNQVTGVKFCLLFSTWLTGFSTYAVISPFPSSIISIFVVSS